MRDHKPATLDKWFESSNLKKFAEKAVDLNQIQEILGKILPDYFKDQFRIGNFSQGILILEVTNATYASRLQYQRMEILSQLRNSGFHQLSTLEIKISPNIYQSKDKFPKIEQKKSMQPKHVSPQTANLLRETAELMPEDIKKRLKNIAKLIE